MLIHANYQDFQRYVGVDSWIAGEAQASLPALTAIVRRGMTAAHRKAAADRTARFAEDHATTLAQAHKAVRLGWDASPITTGRLCSDLRSETRRVGKGCVRTFKSRCAQYPSKKNKTNKKTK